MRFNTGAVRQVTDTDQSPESRGSVTSRRPDPAQDQLELLSTASHLGAKSMLKTQRESHVIHLS